MEITDLLRRERLDHGLHPMSVDHRRERLREPLRGGERAAGARQSGVSVRGRTATRGPHTVKTGVRPLLNWSAMKMTAALAFLLLHGPASQAQPGAPLSPQA